MRQPINLNKRGRIIAAGLSSTDQQLTAGVTLLIFACLVIVFQPSTDQTSLSYDVFKKKKKKRRYLSVRAAGQGERCFSIPVRDGCCWYPCGVQTDLVRAREEGTIILP